MVDLDWWAPLGEPGTTTVHELLSSEVWQRYFAADPEMELELARIRLGGETFDVGARRLTRYVRADNEVVAELDLSGEPDPGGGWQKGLMMLGVPGEALLQHDDRRRSRLRGTLRYLSISTGGRQWVWHFEGGRTAGERLVLSRGDRPGAGAPLVETWPAFQGRSLGNPRGGATVDTHVTRWSADASVADFVLAELLAGSRLDGLVDYLPTRIASGFGELVDLLPRAEPSAE